MNNKYSSPITTAELVATQPSLLIYSTTPAAPLKKYITTEKIMSEQLEGILNPGANDVLSGRGNFVNHHSGNENFRAL